MGSPFQRYLLRKAGWYLFAFFLAMSLNFLLPRLIPGNPAASIVAQMAQSGATSESVQKMYRTFITEFGLDEPMHVQYFKYAGQVLRGNLGTSFMMYPKPVSELIWKAVPWTLAIQIPAILTGWLLGNLLGAFSAYKGGRTDSVAYTGALLTSSIPYYSFAIVLVYVLSVNLRLFPAAGGYQFGMQPALAWPFLASAAKHYILPYLSLVVVIVGGQAIGMREMAIYELGTDYVNYAKALGIRDRKVVGYVFRNAMLPQVTGLALSFGTMMGGALVTESVFSYPGMGSLLFGAIRQTDYPLIQGITLVITISVLVANFLVDVAYGFIDPRIRAAQTGEL